ncbi:hypothetical protein [Arthrobacter sp. zg-Y877]|uniref:hypothetical protein n=1 Tax=Arthrobacter sp. zg-Y877 TaxID=3049074 RepID=UPI0025A42FEF|nr:hypothetical protein [Arthrobacter sp. zg-Y877]MDM7990934.1 hypothetical protein [Arthrobacter sp. zg-Y877]
MRIIRGTAVIPLLLCTAVLLAACAADSGGPSPQSPQSPSESATPGVSPTPSGSSAPPAGDAGAPVSLTIDFRADGTTPSGTWTLQCDGAEPREGSDVPDPVAACALLAEQGSDAFAEPAADLMCTQEIRGMQRAHVTGTVNGEQVDTTFALTDGCEISRWERLTALLGPADGSL